MLLVATLNRADTAATGGPTHMSSSTSRPDHVYKRVYAWEVSHAHSACTKSAFFMISTRSTCMMSMCCRSILRQERGRSACSSAAQRQLLSRARRPDSGSTRRARCGHWCSRSRQRQHVARAWRRGWTDPTDGPPESTFRGAILHCLGIFRSDKDQP